MTRIRPMQTQEKIEMGRRVRSYYIASDTVIQIEGKNSLSEIYKCNKVLGENST